MPDPTVVGPPQFVSPLAITDPGARLWVDFGRPPDEPAIERLGDRLNAEIMGLAADLPSLLRAEAETVLNGYAGGRRFIDLFYRPVWSFLHWVPNPIADAPVLAQACRAQALGLFLHLWDDHLSDGQLAPDLVRLHLRSLAWERFAHATSSLRLVAGVPAGVVDSLVAGYLASVHRPGMVATLDAHAERMVAQVGIWRVVPLLYGTIIGGHQAAQALCEVVERFSVAWRLIDDLQDAAADVCGTQQNALALALDDVGRAAWTDCAAVSSGLSAPDPRTWPMVVAAIERGARVRVVTRVQADLAAARQAALSMRWSGLADELAACRPAP